MRSHGNLSFERESSCSDFISRTQSKIRLCYGTGQETGFTSQGLADHFFVVFYTVSLRSCESEKRQLSKRRLTVKTVLISVQSLTYRQFAIVSYRLEKLNGTQKLYCFSVLFEWMLFVREIVNSGALICFLVSGNTV